MSKMKDAALYWADMGFRVHPCNPQDKLPYLPCDLDANGEKIRGTGGVCKASTDARLIGEWWDERPHAMIGIAMGEIAWAVDPDIPKKPGAPDGVRYWAELQEKHGVCPPTHSHISPSGGRHLLFKCSPDFPLGNGEGQLQGKGINVRGRNAYVIAPPSRWSDGRGYVFADRSLAFKFADAPVWLYELLKPKPIPRRSMSPTLKNVSNQIQGIVGAMANAPHLSRNNLFFWGCCRLAELKQEGIISASNAWGLAHAAGMHSGLEPKEIRESFASAFKGN
jgi:putative DNA primase/helicase